MCTRWPKGRLISLCHSLAHTFIILDLIAFLSCTSYLVLLNYQPQCHIFVFLILSYSFIISCSLFPPTFGPPIFSIASSCQERHLMAVQEFNRKDSSCPQTLAWCWVNIAGVVPASSLCWDVHPVSELGSLMYHLYNSRCLHSDQEMTLADRPRGEPRRSATPSQCLAWWSGFVWRTLH